MMEIEDPGGALPRRYVEALAEEAFAEWERACRRGYGEEIETSALAALRGYARLLADAAPDTPDAADWKVRVGRLRIGLGDVDGGLSLIGEVVLGADHPDGLTALAAVVPDLLDSGDLEASAAVAADVLCRAASDGADPAPLHASMASALRRVSRLDPTVVVGALETSVLVAHATAVAPGADASAALRARRSRLALVDLAAGLRALADAEDAAGAHERAGELRVGAQRVIGSRVFGSGVRSTYRGSSMDEVEVAFDRRSADGGAAFARASGAQDLRDPFDAPIARMYGSVLVASRDPEGAPSALAAARAARADAGRELARAFRAGDALPVASASRTGGDALEEAAEEEVGALYVDALTRALARSAAGAADLLVDEGELVLGLRPGLTSCLADGPDAARRWAKELVALDDRLERSHGATVLGALLRAKELDASGPSATIDPDEVDELLVRVVGDIVERDGLEAVREQLDAHEDAGLTLVGPDAGPVWDRLRGNVEEAAVASGVVPPEAVGALLGRALQHYTAALVPDVGASERAEVLALQAWDRLARDPVVVDHLAPCIVELGGRMAERDPDEEQTEHRIEVLGTALGHLRASDGVTDPERAEAELVLQAQALRSVWADLVPGRPVRGSVVQLVRHGLVDVAGELAAEAEGALGAELLAATEHARAIVAGDRGPEDVARAIRWARAAATEDVATVEAVIEAAVRASPLRSELLGRVPEAEGFVIGADGTDWDAAAHVLIGDLGVDEDVGLGLPGSEVTASSDLDRDHGAVRAVDEWGGPDDGLGALDDGTPRQADRPDGKLDDGGIDL